MSDAAQAHTYSEFLYRAAAILIMGRRRGFFAELEHQAKLAAKERVRAERDAERTFRAAQRREEQARKEEERRRCTMAKADVRERKRLEKELKEAHVASMLAEVERRNTELARNYDSIDGLLDATLNVDDFVDLESLKRSIQHPEFDCRGLSRSYPDPLRVDIPFQPELTLPEEPGFWSRVFGGTKKHVASVADATARHGLALDAWRDKVSGLESQWEITLRKHAEREVIRKKKLAQAKERYLRECTTRAREASDHNSQIDTLVTDLGYGAKGAVEQYVAIVMANSVYPDSFRVEHTFDYKSGSAELDLRVKIPPPAELPGTKAYKYVKASDEVVSTDLSQKARKDRYNDAAHQVALRTLHEVFEADRRGLINCISLEVFSSTVDPATGLEQHVRFVAVAADRDTFTRFKLSDVIPLETLKHLGASLSKNPYGLKQALASGARKV